MNSKFSSILIGFLITCVILVGVIFYFSRSTAPKAATSSDKVFTAADLQKANDATSGLENYGNLPLTVTADQIGRSNPFDQYK